MADRTPSLNLADRWSRVWHRLQLPEPAPSVFQQLHECYSDPARAYHTVDHLAECFTHLDSVWELAENPAAVELALWFHDAIYDTHASDNEARSADWARRVLMGAGAPDGLCQRIDTLILATRHDGTPNNGDACLTVDIDLAILGAAPARFDQYEKQIRQEYGWVDQSAFVEARAKILRRFATQPFIYRTEFFRNRLERQARTNLQTALARLEGGLAN